MIRKLNVNGYKSLRNFSVDFKRGLNVLIGPNGVGKTNICQAISLLSALSNNTLFDLLTQFGGVQSTFNFVGCEEPTKEIEIKVKGDAEGKSKNELYKLKFYYSFSLKLTDELLFSSESLIIKRKSSANRFKTILKINSTDDTVRSQILDKELIGDVNVLKKNERAFSITTRSQESFLPLFSRLFYVCHLVLAEFSRIKSFNIDPNVARNSCDITEPNDMLGNGRYLSNTIYSLDKKAEDLSEINTLLEQLIPGYETLSPEISEINKKRYFNIKDSSGNSFSSNSLSDGTIKLIALLVGIISQNEKTTIIEEPENYLHPYANKILINYLRETFEDGICILTSHSETILNLIKPEELIICELQDCFTVSNRLHNIIETRKKINESGFGCGYHYVSGNLGGTP